MVDRSVLISHSVIAKPRGQSQGATVSNVTCFLHCAEWSCWVCRGACSLMLLGVCKLRCACKRPCADKQQSLAVSHTTDSLKSWASIQR
jgi:hypothetical protein